MVKWQNEKEKFNPDTFGLFVFGNPDARANGARVSAVATGILCTVHRNTLSGIRLHDRGSPTLSLVTILSSISRVVSIFSHFAALQPPFFSLCFFFWTASGALNRETKPCPSPPS